MNLCFLLAAFAQLAAQPAGPRAVATFESIGLSYPSADVGAATVQFRAGSSAAWREGYPLVYDPRLREYRGSLVLLEPGTEYQIRIQAGGRGAELTARTLSETFPVGGTTQLTDADASQTVSIRDGGTETAWRLYTPAPGKRWTSDLQPNGALDVFSGHETHNAVSRNNIFYARGRTYPQAQPGPSNDFKHDLTGGFLGGGFVQSMFLATQNLEWFLAPTMNKIKWGRIEYTRSGKTFAITDPMEPVPNPALDKGVRLPNFNDDFTGAGPDIGAYETGRPPLRFRRESAPGFRPAPWESY